MKETNRVSNIELLRIVAMFMVLLFHANMWSLECCYNEVGLLNDFNANIQSLFNINLESGITCICVNLFVIISGFFGIKLNLKKIKAFVFQCVFIGFVAFLLYWILNPCMKFSGGGNMSDSCIRIGELVCQNVFIINVCFPCTEYVY